MGKHKPGKSIKVSLLIQWEYRKTQKPFIAERLKFCSTYGIRTRDSSVKGRRLNPLTNAPLFSDGKDRGAYLIHKIFENLIATLPLHF